MRGRNNKTIFGKFTSTYTQKIDMSFKDVQVPDLVLDSISEHFICCSGNAIFFVCEISRSLSTSAVNLHCSIL